MRLTEEEARVMGIEKRLGVPVIVKRARVSQGEETLAFQLKAEGITFQREYRFHPTRRWRFDFVIPEYRLAIEVDGSVYSRGRHTRGKGWEEDAIKLSEAAILGWYVMRFSTGQVKSGVAIEQVRRFLSAENTARRP